MPLIKQLKMMEVILYLYKKSRSLVSMGMPVSVLKEENIFDKIISLSLIHILCCTSSGFAVPKSFTSWSQGRYMPC